MLNLFSTPPIAMARPALIGLFLFPAPDSPMARWSRSSRSGPSAKQASQLVTSVCCSAVTPAAKCSRHPFLDGIADRIDRRLVLIMSACGVESGFLALYFARRIAVAVMLAATGIFEPVLHLTGIAAVDLGGSLLQLSTTPWQARRSPVLLPSADR